MAVELFANAGSATVTSGGTTAPAPLTVESWTVTTTVACPVAVAGVSQFRVVDVADASLPPEEMIVTASSNGMGQTWTVTRGAEGTTPVAHAVGFKVVPTLSSGALAVMSQTNPAPSGDTSGVTDQAMIQGLIDAAFTAGGGSVLLRPGTYVVTGLTMKSFVDLNLNTATIRLANGTNADVIKTSSFDSLTNTGTGTWANTAGAVGWKVRNGDIDGNRTNQTYSGGIVTAHAIPSTAPTYGYGIRSYGRNWLIENVNVRNCLAYGIWTEWGIAGGGQSNTNNSVEARAVNVKVHENGIHGWYHRGPSDCQFTNLVLYSNNQAALSTGIDFWAESDNVTNGSGTSKFSPNGLQLSNVHTWGSASKWGMVLDANVSLAGCHAEGASTGQVLARGQVRWVGGSAYYIGTQTSVAGCGIQLGDDGTTSSVPTTASYAANVALTMELSGVLADTAVRAGIRWVNANQSVIRAIIRTRTAPTATIAAGSNGVDLSTLSAGTLFINSVGSLPGSGTVSVVTGNGTWQATYTGTSGGSQLTGVTNVNGTSGATMSTGAAVTLFGVGTVPVSGTVDTGSEVHYEVKGTGLVSGTVQTNSLHYAAGKHRLDIGSQSNGFLIRDNVGGTDVLNVNSSSSRVEIPNGREFRMHSDAYTTATVRLDGLRGHLGFAARNGFSVAIAAAAGAGSSPPAPTLISAASDAAGQANLGTGTSPTTGSQATITFAQTYTSTPIVVLSSVNAATAVLQPYVSTSAAGSFNIAFAVAPTASQATGTYVVNYVVIARPA